MATRSIVRIIPSNQADQGNNTMSAPKYIHLYHHWDGSPSGVGRELDRFLCGRNDGDDSNGMPTWDAERIAEELLTTRQGYEKSDDNHGDVELWICDRLRKTQTNLLRFGIWQTEY